MSADEGVINPDTRSTLAGGRKAAGELLGAAQSNLRRIFLVFLVGFLGMFYAMRIYIWPALEVDLLARGAIVVAITPFDVILLQAKLSILAGILLSLPAFIYYAREPLRRRGLYPTKSVSRWRLVGIVGLSTVLFLGGVFYSYRIFFPVMFDFLATNAQNAGLEPTYSIVYWTQFIFVLALSFGLAAQLPLAMTALAYSGIVPYETFRDNWRYAVMATFVFGALFSPPEPVTQIMWAAPLIALYGLSLYLSRTAVALKRGSDPAEIRDAIRTNWTRLASGAILGGAVAAWAVTDGIGYINRLLVPRIPAAYRPNPIAPESLQPLPGVPGIASVAIIGAAIVTVLLALYYAWTSIEPGRSGRLGDPTAIDLETLDATGVRAAPPEVFLEMDEDSVMEHASRALDDGEPQKAQALIDRFDEVAESDAEELQTDAETTTDQAPGPGRIERATAGVLDSVTGGEDGEDAIEDDDIGGYYYDIRFILGSLRSRTIWLFAVFITILSAVFIALNRGGLGIVREDFTSRLPPSVRPDELNIVTLHPVEALVFEIKVATLLGAVATLPLLLYYAWPALKERGLAGGDRGVFFTWTGAMTLGLIGGSALGYVFVAPTIISYLVWDAIQANMIIAYRVSNFFWLVFFTTVGIGLWINIPVTMLLFHRGRLVTYRTMRDRWRVVALAVIIFAAFFTPTGVISMILVWIPVMLGYGLGLGALWILTIGGRRE